MATKEELIAKLSLYMMPSPQLTQMWMKLSNQALEHALAKYRREQPEVEQPRTTQVDDAVTQQARAEAAAQLAEEQEHLAVEQEQARQEQRWFFILKAIYDGKQVKNITANRSIITSWLHPHEELSDAWLRRVLKEQPQLANQIAWEQYRQPVADSPAVRAADFKTFTQVARERRVSECEANFSACRKALGPGFSGMEVDRWIAENHSQLAQPNTEDQDRWASRELLDAYESGNPKLAELVKRALYSNDKAQLATLHNIKVHAANRYAMAALPVIAAVENEYYRTTGQQVAGRNHEAADTGAPKSYRTSNLIPSPRVDNRQYEPLPASVTTEVLRRADGAAFRRFKERFGSIAVERRYKGVK